MGVEHPNGTTTRSPRVMYPEPIPMSPLSVTQKLRPIMWLPRSSCKYLRRASGSTNFSTLMCRLSAGSIGGRGILSRTKEEQI
jgi:hypothetical protein